MSELTELALEALGETQKTEAVPLNGQAVVDIVNSAVRGS